MTFFKRTKDSLYIAKEWAKRLWIYPQSHIADVAFDYDAYWKERRTDSMGGLGAWQKKRAILASEIISLEGGRTVNDIGAGSGEVLAYIRDHTPLNRAIAYDSSQYALEFAKRAGLEVKLLDATHVSNDLEPADFTVLFEVLEHLPFPEGLLHAAFNSSKKGVLFSFPNTGFFIHRFRLFFFGKFPLQWVKHPSEHLRFWTKKDLVWWLNAQGYASYTVHYYVGIPFLKSIWPNLFAAAFFVHVRK